MTRMMKSKSKKEFCPFTIKTVFNSHCICSCAPDTEIHNEGDLIFNENYSHPQ